MAYTCLFIGTLCLMRLSHRYDPVHENITYKKYAFVLITVLLSLFIGLRGLGVGSDTQTYYYHFSMLSGETFSSLFSRYKSDVGFYLLTKVLAHVLRNYNLYLIFTSLIYLCPVAVLIYKKSSNAGYSYFLFFCFGLFTFALSTLRQSIAIGLCVTAYLMLKKSKFWSVILILLAGSIHYSAFVFLPVVLFDKIKLKKSTRFILFILPIIAAMSLGSLIDVILFFAMQGNYSKTYNVNTSGGVGMVVFLAMVLLLGAYIQKKENIIEDNEYKNLFLLVYCALLVFVSTRFNFAVMRLYYYFLIFIIIYIPNLVRKIKDAKVRLFINLTIIFISIYFLGFKVFSNPYSEASKLLPYYFFWE